MIQELNNVLAVSFTCPTTIEIDDVVEIVDDNEIAAITAPSSAIVGVVCAHRTIAGVGDTTCTVATRFKARRDDRIAGEDVTVGPFVFGADNKVYQYAPASAATHTGANAETFNVGSGSSDVLGVKVGGDEVQSITLTAGTTRTAAQVVADINATAVGFIASATAAAKIKLTATGVNQSLEVTAESHTCNSVLGLTAGVYIGTANSHDPGQIAGLVILAGDEGDAVETLELI